jgi:L-ascorbate metabolism protein UlaG (beta-lactamase superfamily)
MRMMAIIMALGAFGVFGTALAGAQENFEKDVITTSAGNLEITFIGHGSLILTFGGKVIHIDPFGQVADYVKLPKADLILLTHEHGDHLDPGALQKVRTDKTVLILTQKCAEKVTDGTVMKNGDIMTVMGIKIEAVPAYNVVNKRPDGQAYHPKGDGNGYVLTFGDKRIYIAGDTENIPEMKAQKSIDYAFLPMNLPYTMTPEMVADGAKAFMPKVLYPYHFGDTDTSRLVALLKNTQGIEVRIRKMK